MVLDLDESQRAAIAVGVRGLDDPGGTTKINGPAGTGKTTIIREVLASGVGEDAVVLAPTNKAAHVLRGKGIPAQTIHSALYAPKSVALREALRAVKEALDAPDLSADDGNRLRDQLREIEADLQEAPQGERLSFTLRTPNAVTDHPVVVDEASMVGGQLYADLRDSTDMGIVLVGDDAQLPPVRDEAVFHGFTPGATLRTVHRQDADSPVLAIATLIREDRMAEAAGLAREASVLKPMHEAPWRSDVKGEIEIVWRNATRHDRNAWHRDLQGRRHWLEKTDWLISLRNRGPEYNGSFCRVLPALEREFDRVKVTGAGWRQAPIVRLDCDEEEILRPIAVTENGAPARVWAACGWDYAYAVTAHKSQGSEWDSVTVYDEWSWADDDPHRAEDRRRWLYTAVTRARKELIWCQ